jgi:putative nucleotidyltransferase with HDIG domain
MKPVTRGGEGAATQAPCDEPFLWLEAYTHEVAAAPDAAAAAAVLLRAAASLGCRHPRVGLWRAADSSYAMTVLDPEGDAVARGSAPASLYGSDAPTVLPLSTPRGRWGILDLGAPLPDPAAVTPLKILAANAALCIERHDAGEAPAPDNAFMDAVERWCGAPNAEALVRTALRDVACICDAESAAILLPDAGPESPMVLFSEDLDDGGPLPWRSTRDSRRNGEALKSVHRTGQALAFRRRPGTEALKFGFLPAGPEHGTWNAVPLADADGVLGALDIFSGEPGHFGPECVDDLTRAAAILARLLRRLMRDDSQAHGDVQQSALLDAVSSLADKGEAAQIAATLSETMRRMWPDADIVYTMLPHREGGLWSVAALDSLDPEDQRHGWARAGEGFAGWVIQTHAPLTVDAAADDPRRGALDRGQRVKSGVWAPMERGGAITGLLSLVSTRSDRAFQGADEEMLGRLAALGAVALERSRMRQGVHDAFWDAIEAISGAIDARDGYTHGHSRNVTEYAVAIAKRMEMPAADVQTLRASALMHDIGKIGIPDHILNKPANLTPDERTVMESHPEVGYQILLRAPSLQTLLPGVRYHHERPDGKGYPCGLSGDALPLQARIMAVADAFDAMTSDRVYRKRMTVQKAVGILCDGRGTQWDAECVDHFAAIVASLGTPRLQLLAAEDSGRQYLPSLGVDVFGP